MQISLSNVIVKLNTFRPWTVWSDKTGYTVVSENLTLGYGKIQSMFAVLTVEQLLKNKIKILFTIENNCWLQPYINASIIQIW